MSSPYRICMRVSASFVEDCEDTITVFERTFLVEGEGQWIVVLSPATIEEYAFDPHALSDHISVHDTLADALIAAFAWVEEAAEQQG
jgi:hypothetical protein